jgi:hypothetical protein
MELHTTAELIAARDEAQRFGTELNHAAPWNGPALPGASSWEIRLENGCSLELANLFLWFVLATD